jgi:hypothetical protein
LNDGPLASISSYVRLEAAGIPYERDESAWSRGLLRLSLRPVVDGKPLGLVAEFPDNYPYFRFEVYAPVLIWSDLSSPT